MIPSLQHIRIRPAQTADAPLAAKVMYMSMGALADYLFDMPAHEIEAVLAKLFMLNAGRFGSGIAVVAEHDEKPVGMLFSFPAAKLNRFNVASFPHFFPTMGFKHALQFMRRGISLPGGAEAEKDEYYISNLGILPDARRQGLGRTLLGYAEKACRDNRLSKCSLIVGLHNEKAFHIYKQAGYQVVETAQDPNEALAYHRMVKQLS